MAWPVATTSCVWPHNAAARRDAKASTVEGCLASASYLECGAPAGVGGQTVVEEAALVAADDRVSNLALANSSSPLGDNDWERATVVRTNVVSRGLGA
jgi:hypothetical protein